MDVTRRALARMLAVTAAVPALAPLETAVAQSAPPGADSDLNAARNELRSNAQKLAQVRVPLGTQPAFRFKA
jgi:hypothetical protein